MTKYNETRDIEEYKAWYAHELGYAVLYEGKHILAFVNDQFNVRVHEKVFFQVTGEWRVNETSILISSEEVIHLTKELMDRGIEDVNELF